MRPDAYMQRAHAGADERPRALPMVTNSVSLMLGKAATMALGFLFWLVAARHFEASEVGLAAGVVAAMMLCTQLAVLGVGSAVITRFPENAAQPRRLLDTAFTVAGGAAIAAAAAFLLLSSNLFRELSVVNSTPLYALLFFLMCLVGTIGIVLDQVSIALRRGDQVLIRGAVFGGITVVLLLAVASATQWQSSIAIFSPWVIAGLGACALGSFQLWRSLSNYRYRPYIEVYVAKDLLRVGMPNYALTLTERAPGLLVPIVVTELLSPAANATWYVVWMMAWVVFIIPISAGLALFSEGVHRPEALRSSVSQAVRSALGIGLLSAATIALLAPSLLSLLGESYADDGATPLRILVWTVAPLVFVQAYFSACRARQKLREAILTGAVAGVVAVAAASVAGVAYGLNGMAVAWLASQFLAGTWAIWRIRSLRERDGRHDPEGRGLAWVRAGEASDKPALRLTRESAQ